MNVFRRVLLYALRIKTSSHPQLFWGASAAIGEPPVPADARRCPGAPGAADTKRQRWCPRLLCAHAPRGLMWFLEGMTLMQGNQSVLWDTRCSRVLCNHTHNPYPWPAREAGRIPAGRQQRQPRNTGEKQPVGYLVSFIQRSVISLVYFSYTHSHFGE